MKKTLHWNHTVFVEEKNGEISFWNYTIEEVLNFSNLDVTGEPITLIQTNKALRAWMTRFLEEGITDELLDDLNKNLHKVKYSKYIVPIDLLPPGADYPQERFIADKSKIPNTKELAANHFSMLLTSGALKKLKICELPDCENFFVGPPQARWCSKSCGSKFRVRKKRKRES